MGISRAPLTTAEYANLATYEQVIERGLRTFYEVGNALTQIREQRLYRASHLTFEDYCRERWGMVSSRARQLIAASTVVSNLGRDATILPTSESQARPLARLEPEKQRLAWGIATEIAGDNKITAALVSDIAAQIKSPTIRPDPVALCTVVESGEEATSHHVERQKLYHQIPLSQLWAATQNLQVAIAMVYGSPLRSPVARALSALQALLPPVQLDTIDIITIGSNDQETRKEL